MGMLGHSKMNFPEDSSHGSTLREYICTTYHGARDNEQRTPRHDWYLSWALKHVDRLRARRCHEGSSCSRPRHRGAHHRLTLIIIVSLGPCTQSSGPHGELRDSHYSAHIDCHDVTAAPSAHTAHMLEVRRVLNTGRIQFPVCVWTDCGSPYARQAATSLQMCDLCLAPCAMPPKRSRAF